MAEEKLYLPKSEIKKMVRSLQKEFAVIAPVRRGEREVVFKKLASYEEPELNLDYTLSVLPPQKISLFPSHQCLFNFQFDPLKITESIEADKPTILFGVHITDLLALTRLDEVFSKPYKDEAYRRKRDQLIIIGLDYPAHPDAFVPPKTVQGNLYDLFLDDVGKEYQVLVGSEKGQQLIQSIPLRRTTKQVAKGRPYEDVILADTEKLMRAVENSKDSKLWDEMAEVCLGCGICTWVCPLCYCFDVQDKLSLDGNGCRERIWDSCLLKNFARIGGDINFREKLRDRFYNWYHHKFVRMPKEYGFVGCTGCGRCTAYCPVGINIKKNLVRLVREEEEKERLSD